MTQDRQTLHRNRCSTQEEFLFSQTDTRECDPMSDSDRSDDHLISVGLYELSEAFPDILSGKTLTDAAMTRLESSSAFGAMAVRIDSFSTGTKTDAEKHEIETHAADILLDVARAVDSTCNLSDTSRGIWGEVTHGVLGCFFPEKDEASCLELADTLRKNLALLRDETVTIGIALYPLIQFGKNEILENACKALDHAAFSGPGNTAVFDAVSLNISGDKLYQKGKIDEAIEEFGKALLIDPSNINVHNSLGVCYGVLGIYKKAFEEFKTAIRLDNNEIMAIYNAGLINLFMGNKDNALKFFLVAGRLGEDVFEVAFQTGRLYLEMEKLSDAKNFLEKAATLRPSSGSVFRYLGECYTALKMKDQAILAYKKAIKLNPYDATSLSALGYLFDIQNENPEIATVFCQHSVALSPENGLFRHRLGRLYLKQNRKDEALAEFIRAANLGHDSHPFIEEIQKPDA